MATLCHPPGTTSEQRNPGRPRSDRSQNSSSRCEDPSPAASENTVRSREHQPQPRTGAPSPPAVTPCSCTPPTPRTAPPSEPPLRGMDQCPQPPAMPRKVAVSSRPRRSTACAVPEPRLAICLLSRTSCLLTAYSRPRTVSQTPDTRRAAPPLEPDRSLQPHHQGGSEPPSTRLRRHRAQSRAGSGLPASLRSRFPASSLFSRQVCFRFVSIPVENGRTFYQFYSTSRHRVIHIVWVSVSCSGGKTM